MKHPCKIQQHQTHPGRHGPSPGDRSPEVSPRAAGSGRGQRGQWGQQLRVSLHLCCFTVQLWPIHPNRALQHSYPSAKLKYSPKVTPQGELFLGNISVLQELYTFTIETPSFPWHHPAALPDSEGERIPTSRCRVVPAQGSEGVLVQEAVVLLHSADVEREQRVWGRKRGTSASIPRQQPHRASASVGGDAARRH